MTQPCDSRNPELQLAADYVLQTGTSLFLTGKAGTGKSTFLLGLKGKTAKRMIIAAPTGVAAINVGGVTLHSFFQMPFGPLVPGSENSGRNRQYRFSREKKNIMLSLDLLIIDEISMVRADLLDGIDAVLRRFRRSPLPFGGVQLLMIGDLHQLPPVVKDDEWQILGQHYATPYFFSSHALAKTELVTLELQHIYRQSDNRFINLLNRVRDNRLDRETLDTLNSRCVTGSREHDDAGYITLCSHNRQADAVNTARLEALPSATHSFTADIEGEFPEYTYPAPDELVLKKGAQVMFVRNDPSEAKRFYNGKIGTITAISNKTIRVRCDDSEQEIEVEPVSWENIKYTVNEQSGEITEEKIGTFLQYPLKLAWAITIHKSQGLTFEKAIIDANAAFAHGQVYVALSRCKSFAGMVLSSSITAQSVKTDPVIIDFLKQATDPPPTRAHFEEARLRYQQQLLLQCFDFGRLRFLLGRLTGILAGNAQVISFSGQAELQELRHSAEEEIFRVSENFSRQLTALFAEQGLPETDPVLQERAIKAARYFQEKLNSGPVPFLENLQVETDSKELHKRIKKAHDHAAREVLIKLAATESCLEGFSPNRYLYAVSAAEMHFKPAKKKKTATVEYSASDIEQPELFQQLKEWRTRQAAEEGLPHYRILHQRVLIQIAMHMPTTITDLRAVQGIGKVLAAKYGEELIKLVADYRTKHQITEVILPDPKPVAEKPAQKKQPAGSTSNTRQISLDLFKQGLSIDKIAEHRELVISTIENHLASFVESGELDIDELLEPEKKGVIAQKLTEMKDQPFGEIKKALGDDYSYGEIRMVQASLNNQSKK